MKKRVALFILCLSFISAATAKMPFYDDDVEFDRCTKMTGDWNRCMSEETRRTLNDIKLLYREVLTNPQTTDWNKSNEQNQQMLRDLYSSWIAFRNRLCSLSKVSAKYTGGWKDEELSCVLYYTKHHKDHFQCINDMLLARADERDNFITDDHDAQYTECIKDGDENKCLLNEIYRSSDKIKNLYKEFYNSQYTSGWNNGADLGNGNYRDMFDSWIAYRNRMCSLSEYAYQHFPAHVNITKNHCLQYLNREKLEALENLFSLSKRAVNNEKAQKKSEDGGKAAGQAIVPLANRPEINESLVGSTSESKTEEKIESTEDTSRLPSWARRNK